MSLALNIPIYADFKNVVSIFPKKFMFFFHEIPGSSDLRCWAVSTDMQALVELNASDDVSGDLRSTFITDFPGAMEFTSLVGASAVGPPLFASSFTKDFPT